MRSQARRVLEGARVLLVEDADDAREAFAALLRTEGAEVMSAATAREALDLLDRYAFDAIVTDLGLPDIPGEILISEVVATVSRRPLIVVVTGFGDPYVGRAREAGADKVLAKPIEWSVLLRHLEGVGRAARLDGVGRAEAAEAPRRAA